MSTFWVGIFCICFCEEIPKKQHSDINKPVQNHTF